MVLRNTTPAEIRSEFKDAYYGIGDGVTTLDLIRYQIKDAAAEMKMASLTQKFEDLHKELKEFGDRYFPNWD